MQFYVSPTGNDTDPGTKDKMFATLERALDGLKCGTAVHICYGYGIEENIKWKETLGETWDQYEKIFPALNASTVEQISAHQRVHRESGMEAVIQLLCS